MNKLLQFLLIAFCITAKAQVDKTKIKAQAEEAGQALLAGSFEVLGKYTYPKVAERFGGVDNMEAARSGREDLVSMGINLDSVGIGEPSEAVIAGDQLHCLIPKPSLSVNPMEP